MFITTGIRKMLASPKWKAMDPQKINQGYCAEFAEDVNKITGGSILETAMGSSFPPHTWITHQGQHFDAETPNGVADWRHLPRFKRHFADLKRPAFA